MLVHHAGIDYNVAASEAANEFRTKMEDLIHKGTSSALSVLEQVQTQVPTDRVIKAKSLRFGVTQVNNSPALYVQGPDAILVDGVTTPQGDFFNSVHNHALRQTVERAGIPHAQKYIDTFRNEKGIFVAADQSEKPVYWGADMIAHNLNTIHQYSDKKYLTRSVDGQMRGVLSDSYRRLDARPMLEAFAMAAREIGAHPIEGYALDTKVTVKAMLPLIFEPVPNEVICFGLQWGTSDFGNGAHEIMFYALRLACTNKAQVQDVLRQVHLGKRLSEDMAYSQKTYELDTMATASAITDTVKAALSPGAIEAYCTAIKDANEQKIDGFKVKDFLRKKGLLKGEVDSVVEKFNSADVELLPPGNTAWRMSNAVSWFAGETESKERRLEIEKVAGEFIKPETGLMLQARSANA